MSLKVNLNVLGKVMKSAKHFRFQQKKKPEKLIKILIRNIGRISCKITFIDSAKFVAGAKFVAEGIHKNKCKDYNCFLEHENVNGNLNKVFILK